MKTLFLMFLPILLSIQLYSQQVDENTILRIAEGKIIQMHQNHTIESVSKLFDESGKLFLYRIDLKPHGYILAQTDQRLEPVLAYSFSDSFDERFNYLFVADAKERMSVMDLTGSARIENNRSLWNELIDPNPNRLYEQWPPEGSTATGGWLESNWHQSNPYNAMCPFDVVNNQRSVAGCPAVAAAMILNFNKKLNGTTFSDDDDYHHNYGGNNFYIDDDYDAYKFPNFDSLNVILDTIQSYYDQDKALSNYEKAGLVFACGTAATQVYNAAGSGTFGVSQAYDLYMKFGFEEALLYETLSDEMYDTLIYNMKHALPSHLAVVDQNWQYGHNVVVDGYNTDGYFHINFGWGGTSNGWWHIPDDGFPYTMNVLEGIIVNINYEEPIISVIEPVSKISIYPNPGTGLLRFVLPADVHFQKAEAYSIDGKLLSTTNDHEGIIDLTGAQNGTYIIKVYTGQIVYQCLYILSR
jgi:hypothetical protein